MIITLMHNTGAGPGAGPSKKKLIAALERAGHEVRYQSTREPGATWALLDPGDLVVVAGGDGTVRKIALALAGRSVPMTILPLGTANNMAKTFGLDGSIEWMANGMEKVVRTTLNIGLAEGPWGKAAFVESAGSGVLAQTIAAMSQKKTDKTSSLVDSRREFLSRLERYPVQEMRVNLDGRDLSGRFAMIEAMNMRLVGPNLHLAPESDAGDGRFDFVFLREDEREAFAQYLTSCKEQSCIQPPVTIVRGKKVQIEWERMESIHIDDEVWPEKAAKQPKKKKPGKVTFAVASTTLDILAPRRAEEAKTSKTKTSRARR
jgi:diacylglycerol kinase (ATP)